jgi:membrane fusion protein (multidrug efflux system)
LCPALNRLQSPAGAIAELAVAPREDDDLEIAKNHLGALWAIASTLCAGALFAVAAQEFPGVIIAAVTRVEFPLTVEALGTAGANESVTIRPKISETVTAIHFKEGELLAAGQVLIELEDAEARAAVASAKASLLDAGSKYKRNQELFSSDLVPESQVETSEAQRDAALAALDAAEARLRDTVLRAPFAGRVGLRRVSLGSLVGPATVITTLDDTRTIKLDFDVPETALSHLATGLKVVAHSAAWPDVSFEGTVESIDTRVDPISRTLTVRALVPNAEYLLRPGMFLRVELLRHDVTALMVPEQAIVPEQSRQFVFVVGEGGMVAKRQVRIGRRRPGQVEVVDGVAAGEDVVVEGTQKAQDGARVQIIRRMEVAQ